MRFDFTPKIRWRNGNYCCSHCKAFNTLLYIKKIIQHVFDLEVCRPLRYPTP